MCEAKFVILNPATRGLLGPSVRDFDGATDFACACVRRICEYGPLVQKFRARFTPHPSAPRGLTYDVRYWKSFWVWTKCISRDETSRLLTQICQGVTLFMAIPCIPGIVVSMYRGRSLGRFLEVSSRQDQTNDTRQSRHAGKEQ